MESIFRSQVEPVMKFAKLNAENFLHISLEPGRDGSSEFNNRLDEIASEFDTRILIQTRNLMNHHAVKDSRHIERLINQKYQYGSRVVIHARGLANSYKAVLLKRRTPQRYRVHADMRGVLWDEATRGNWVRQLMAPYRRRLYLDWERQTAKYADTVSCVSMAYQNYFKDKHNRPDTEMIPTFVDQAQFNFLEELRLKYRKKLGISDQPILVFCGGSAYWQNIVEIIDLYEKLSSHIKKLVMLFLTHAPDTVRDMVGSRIKPENRRILRVEHRQVPGYLCAADIALLLRDDIPTNNYAAPTKFGEYLCCGLPVIISPKIGDTEELIRSSGYGIVLNRNVLVPESNRLMELLHADREAISQFGIKQYSKELYLPRLMELYLGENA